MARGSAHASFPDLNGEVTIAGGGLAGLSLAAGLRLHDVPVTVHEAGSYPRHRVCGEFISGVEMRTLEALGIADLFAVALSPSSVAWFREGRCIHQDRLPSPAIGISRHRLDDLLKERVREQGGQVIERSRQTRDPHEGFVWAAGRIPAKSKWIGLKVHCRDLEMAADLEMHLGTNGYAGLAGVENFRVNVCGLFHVDRSLHGTGPELLLKYLRAGGNDALAERIADRTDTDSFCAVAGFALGRQASDPELCAVGDAESMIPPFTGNGMSMAFQAAEIALVPLIAWSRGSLSWDACAGEIRDTLHQRFRKRLGAARTMHPLLLHAGGQRLMESMARTRLLPFRQLLSLVR